MSPTAARAPSLETIGMSKSFGALKALQDVSIKVPAGSFNALLGENGADKSSESHSTAPRRSRPALSVRTTR